MDVYSIADRSFYVNLNYISLIQVANIPEVKGNNINSIEAMCTFSKISTSPSKFSDKTFYMVIHVVISFNGRQLLNAQRRIFDIS